jgi:hypothetical protein
VIYLANNDVTLNLDVSDVDGLGFTVNSVDYEVTDERGSIIVSKTPAANFVVGESSVPVTIVATENQLQDKATRGLRLVTVFLNTNYGVVTNESHYIIQAQVPLIVAVNSFQTFQSALFRAQTLTGVGSWLLATKEEKINSLIQARDQLMRVPFAFVGEDLDDLDEISYTTLEQEFRDALENAQVLQAAYLLDLSDSNMPESVSDLISNQNGEAKQVFKSVKGIESTYSKAVMREIQPYVKKFNRVWRG